MGLELYCNDEDGVMDASINDVLVQREVLRVETEKKVNRVNTKCTLMRPG